MLYLQLHKIQHAQRHCLITFWSQNCNYLHVSRFPWDVTVRVYPKIMSHQRKLGVSWRSPKRNFMSIVRAVFSLALIASDCTVSSLFIINDRNLESIKIRYFLAAKLSYKNRVDKAMLACKVKELWKLEFAA